VRAQRPWLRSFRFVGRSPVRLPAVEADRSPGEQTRAYFAPGVPLETPERSTLIVNVQYSDASTSSILRTEATIQYRRGVWRVMQVAIWRDDEHDPLVISAAAV